MRIVPNGFDFFSKLEQEAQCVCTAVECLDRSLSSTESATAACLSEIHQLERDGDKLLRAALERLERQLSDMVPAEDVFRLFTHLDKIIDTTEALAVRLFAFRLTSVPHGAIRLMAMARSCGNVLLTLIDAFGKGEHSTDLVEEMLRIENEADDVFQAALEELFHMDTDPVRLLELYEVYGYLEKIIDLFEDCAQAVEGISLKHRRAGGFFG